MEYPSKLVENAVNEISKLPGIGKKTALRLVLYLLKENVSRATNLSEAILKLCRDTVYCKTCNNISDDDECAICSSSSRDSSILCIVEDTRDVLAIENTGQYNGVYHVLGGIISPVEGIGPADLNIEGLLKRVNQHNFLEVMLALRPTMDGDTTAFYLTKKIQSKGLKITTIARGIPVGGELEYIDEITLGRSILSRVTSESI